MHSLDHQRTHILIEGNIPFFKKYTKAFQVNDHDYTSGMQGRKPGSKEAYLGRCGGVHRGNVLEWHFGR